MVKLYLLFKPQYPENHIYPGVGQPIKIDIDLSIDKSMNIGKSDLIDIDCIDQSVEFDDTLVFFSVDL